MKRYILKAATHWPTSGEVLAFEEKYGIKIEEAHKLYLSYKDGKRRRIKRFRYQTTELEQCAVCYLWHILNVKGHLGKVA